LLDNGKIRIRVEDNNGSGSRRPKNFWIGIHNTAFCAALQEVYSAPFLMGTSKLVAAVLEEKKAAHKQVFCSTVPFLLAA
jgi:hypothetical protein